MARRHRAVLAKLDPVAVARYQITEKDIRTIERHPKIVQRDIPREIATWQNVIDFDGPYATSIVVHETLEIRLLQARGIQPLKLSTKVLQRTIAQQIEAYNMATYEEHLFLQEYISRTFQQYFEVATLICANRDDNRNLELFLESEVGIFRLELEAIETVIPIGERLRWLPIEVIADEEAKAYLMVLDHTCGFPKPQPIGTQQVMAELKGETG